MALRFLVVLVALGAWMPSAFAQTFTNVTVESGLEAIRASRPGGYWMSGLQLVDLDSDGDLDFFFGAHHGEGGIASLNDGRGKFTAVPGWSPSEIHIAYDLDEDGKLDVSLTEGDGGGRWWLNGSMAGALAFRKSSFFDLQARTQFMVDINRDGKVDWLAVGSGSGSSAGAGTRVFLGDGKGGFAAMAVALAGANSFSDLVDLDGDGDKDALLTRGNYPNTPAEPVETKLYRNDGAMAFTDVTAQVGLAVPGLFIHGHGDVDQDGDVDLFGLESNGTFPVVVYLNSGAGVFTKKATAVNGPARGRAVAPNPGLGTVTDLDNDGVADILIGGVAWMHVLRGTGGGAFAHMNPAWGNISSDGQLPDASFAFGDIDSDGDLDLATYRQTYPQKLLNLYRNDLPKKNWVRVRAVGLAGNKGALGSVVRIHEPGTSKLLWFEEITSRAKQVQQNYYAHVETERHFGLGDRTLVDVSVHFYPSNKLVKKTGVMANTIVRISEDGSGSVVAPPTAPPLPPVLAGGDAGAPATPPDAGSAVDARTAGGSGGAVAAGGAGGTMVAGAAGRSGGGVAGSATSSPAAGPAGGAAPPAMDDDGETGQAAAGCACRTAAPSPASSAAPVLLGVVVLLRRIRTRVRRPGSPCCPARAARRG